jgi:DNA polymerase II large subunit
MKLDIEVEAKPHVQKYYSKILEETERQLSVAEKAKAKGLDVSLGIESKPVADLADRTETIIGPVGIAKRYREVFEEKKGDRMEAIFQLFREILEQKWCKIEDRGKRIEQAIRTGLVLNTEGVVVAPLDGVPKVEINKNPDGSEYIDIYYAGPIRAAGGTSQVLPLILGDYARSLLEVDRYKPTDDEVERYVEECQIYDEIVTRQYKPTDDEVRKIVRGCPVCINGEPTEEREVAVNRDLPRIPKNRVRGGMCLVLSEGVALKAAKILKFAKKLNLDWSWLEGIIKVGKSDSGEKTVKVNDKYLTGAAAGRPILAYPSRFGGFRLRYGRSRNMGIMGKGIHPATMHLLDEFIANATQMKVERPGKAAGMAPVDSIEGPIVKLLNGSVVKAKSLEEAKRLKPSLDKILFLGDLLISVGDFRYSAHPLVPAGYCPEWWAKEVERQLGEKAGELGEMLKEPGKVNARQAIELSKKYHVPLHPNALFYYSGLEKRKLVELAKFLKTGKRAQEKDGLSEGQAKNEAGKKEAARPKAVVEFENGKEKALFEKIGLCHKVKDGKILVEEDDFNAVCKTLAIEKGKLKEALEKSVDVFSALSLVSGMQIRDLAGTWIGARMGRPEASKPRKMIGNPHVLFPIGQAGGNIRSVNKAMQNTGEGKEGSVIVEIALYRCPKCEAIGEQAFCKKCQQRCEKVSVCPSCGKTGTEKKCAGCGTGTEWFSKRSVDLEGMVHKAAEGLGMRIPELVKGVKGMINFAPSTTYTFLGMQQ